ncbi:general secretion pathway protein GspK [Pseudomonas sp. JR33AA]|uniref:general secretion pathway protein GspK n=1 Tax=Pseudomonas sp. JR33AA TaxID=2899113 RepID=UPI001F4454F7|nr:type II secretion system protein GspK [Pseudomonas sp. JR33AA]MCE5975622.1 type II secretion system protein GspK [Pseudomonas sp. JR33AA]
MKSSQQRGLALITVLLTMSLVSFLVAGMLRSHQGMLGSVGQQIEASRLLKLALAGERHALGHVKQQVATVLQVTHLGQPWARSRQLNFGEGQLRYRLEDLSGRFNLAALTAGGPPNPILLERWERLCRSLQIEPPALDALLGQPMLDPSQLRALPGIDIQALARLQPWVTVLPHTAGLNINTASARLLAALEGVELSVARQLVAERPEQGTPTVQRFLALPPLDGLGIDSHGLSVTSRWYRLEVQAVLANRLMYLYSDLEIDLNTHQVRVIRRSYSAQPELRPDE